MSIYYENKLFNINSCNIDLFSNVLNTGYFKKRERKNY